MSAVGVLIMGAGAYLMYYAVRHKSNHPIAHAKTALKSVTGGTTGG